MMMQNQNQMLQLLAQLAQRRRQEDGAIPAAQLDTNSVSAQAPSLGSNNSEFGSALGSYIRQQTGLTKPAEGQSALSFQDVMGKSSLGKLASILRML